jgi:multidrug efflux pump
MNISHFFIDRPIFAAVISIIITLVGGVAYFALPVAQYPDIAPPSISVTAQYPGASAEIVAKTVATPIEQEVNGVDNMLYMTSQSTGDGNMSLAVTFKLGTDLDTAQVLVQNRVAIAQPRLPEEVRAIGVTVTKQSPDLMLVIHLFSPDGTRDQLYISNYATLHVKDVLSRIDGVGNVTIFGARDYSMRIWLDPEKLAIRNLTAGDVVAALRGQNVQVAAGVIPRLSATSSSSRAATGAWCGSTTSAGSSSVPPITAATAISMRKWRCPSASFSVRAPMHLPPRRKFKTP